MLEKPHKKLDVWKKSMELVRQIYELTKSYPMAQGSLSELDTHLEICLALGYVKERSLRELSLLMNDVDKMLSGLIKSLKRC